MKIYYELDLNGFEAWSGAKSTLERIKNEDKIDELERLLDELYPDGMDETQLNDLLWFEPDWLYENIGIRTENQIQEEIENLEYELSNLLSDYQYDLENAESDAEKEEIQESYKDDIEELQERIDELKEELNNL